VLFAADHAAQGFVSGGVAFSRDMLTAEVLLSGQQVVRRATERQICGVVLAAFRKGFQMMDFEAVGFATALAAFVNVSAASSVALEDCASFGGWNVSAAAARPGRVLDLT